MFIITLKLCIFANEKNTDFLHRDFTHIFIWGALIFRAEIIPFEPARVIPRREKDIIRFNIPFFSGSLIRILIL